SAQRPLLVSFHVSRPPVRSTEMRIGQLKRLLKRPRDSGTSRSLCVHLAGVLFFTLSAVAGANAQSSGPTLDKPAAPPLPEAQRPAGSPPLPLAPMSAEEAAAQR